MAVSELGYQQIKEKSIEGRYLTLDHLEGLIPQWENRFDVGVIGTSVSGENVYRVQLGKGPRKVLMWSQMHGNESTTTKAVVDLLSWFNSGGEGARDLLAQCTIRILPLLNPDGARLYTRANANKVDLNRDAQALSQPESRALREQYLEFQPHYCFNLHDQRTIFNVGDSPEPATLSFLAPAMDAERSISEGRARSMKLIAAIHHHLKEYVPGRVGRYDDGFNLNCVGDTFQASNTPTLLFEAGHHPGDYGREQTRFFVFQALLAALASISGDSFTQFEVADYFEIPENSKQFYDIIIREPHLLNPIWEEGLSLGLQYKEVLKKGNIYFIPEILEAGRLGKKFGHEVYNCALSAHRESLLASEELVALLFLPNQHLKT